MRIYTFLYPPVQEEEQEPLNDYEEEVAPAEESILDSAIKQGSKEEVIAALNNLNTWNLKLKIWCLTNKVL